MRGHSTSRLLPDSATAREKIANFASVHVLGRRSLSGASEALGRASRTPSPNTEIGETGEKPARFGNSPSPGAEAPKEVCKAFSDLTLADVSRENSPGGKSPGGNSPGGNIPREYTPSEAIPPDHNLTETLEHIESFEVPSVLVNQGLLLLKVSHKSKKKIRFWVDSANFRFVYKHVSKNSVHSFYVDDIRSITPRELASHYREELGISKEFERRWISIAYFNHRKNKTKNLHLIADTSHDAKRLVYTVGKFKNIKDQISNDFLVNLKDLDEVKRSILSGKAEHTDRSQKQVLTFAEVVKYCRRLRINVTQERLRELFSRVASSRKDEIDFDDFKRFVMLLTRRDDVSAIWTRLVGPQGRMTLEIFAQFITNVQKESPDPETLAKAYRRFAPSPEAGMSEDNFAQYLKSKFCTTSKEVFLQDDYFSHPLNEYFILSSHNTYLTGRQVGGDSSVEGYVKALQRGCRCLEIDVWNSQTDPSAEPIVNHGRTFTNGISLTNVLATIKKFAFHTTHYPLILSLEVHCSPRAQVLMAQILKDTFGSALVVYPLDSRTTLPSPEELKDRVLIKVKKTSEGSSGSGVDENGRFLTSSTTQTSFSESNESGSNPRFKLRRKPTSKVSETLSVLGVYCQGLKFRNFSLPESKTFNHCFSLSEKSANTMLRDPEKAEALDKHNRRYLMRIYPSKIRLRSSNFIPLTYWEHGVQMVATNWQTYDLGQQLNEAFFDVSQGLGYVLKPPDLRKRLVKSTLRKVAPERKEIVARFSIEVVSAQQLPKTPESDFVNPFVTLEILGASSIDWDTSSRIGATDVVAENGFNPIWNSVFSGKLVADTELVFLRLTIHTSVSKSTIESPKEICLSVTNFFDLNQGYRHVPLKDLCGETLVYSSLFVNISYERIC
ncbi:hypothetical protein JCM33374_g4394 [Metschnikowia sp. JCM 33374]|nr:hypothetical protein JCM33374_g4394 [Metschnikowia sp. JCM 33374]